MNESGLSSNFLSNWKENTIQMVTKKEQKEFSRKNVIFFPDTNKNLEMHDFYAPFTILFYKKLFSTLF